MLSTVLGRSAAKNTIMEVPARRECGPDKVRAPLHHQSMLGWICTVPNMMVYARVLVMYETTFLWYLAWAVPNNEAFHVSSLLWGEAHMPRSWCRIAPVVGILFNQCVLDVLDGYIARRFGWCTSIGRYLDISTDTVNNCLFFCLLTYHLTHSEAASLGWLQSREFESDGVKNMYAPSQALWLFLFLFTWWQFFGTCVSLGAASNWKTVEYPCPFARFYYRQDAMFLCYLHALICWHAQRHLGCCM
jgi:phosphatidylglycerophosphate synthase